MQTQKNQKKKPRLKLKPKPKPISGQAVIEGVMFHSQNKIATAIQKGKQIIVKKEKIKYRESRIPFLRGIINLIIMLYVGTKALNRSSAIALEKKEKDHQSTILIIFSLIVATAIAIFLFKFIPYYATSLITSTIKISSPLFALAEGIIKVIILLAYIISIAQLADIKRTFQFHGAEHKVVNCYEAKKPLTIKNIARFTTLNPRCGTSFIFLVIFISIILYSLIPIHFSFLTKFAIRIILLPVIISLSYEAIKLSQPPRTKPKTRTEKIKQKIKTALATPITYPGLLTQKITTQQPNTMQIKVALKAFKAVTS